MKKQLMLGLLLVIGACTQLDSGANADAPAATSSPATAVVERFYGAMKDGDMDTVGALLGDDVKWSEAESSPLAAGNPYVGMDGVGAGVFGPITQTFTGFAATPGRFTTEGNRVVVEGRYTGTHAQTGEPLDAQFVHVFIVDGDRIAEFQQYTDTHQWRRLAGALGG